MEDKEMRTNVIIGGLTILVGTGMLIGVDAAVDANYKKEEIKNLINNESLLPEDGNGIYEYKRICEPRTHRIGYSYIKPFNSSEVPDINIPDGYEIYSQKTKTVKINGKYYLKTETRCINNVEVVVEGIYDATDNEIRYITPGIPLETMKLVKNTTN